MEVEAHRAITAIPLFVLGTHLKYIDGKSEESVGKCASVFAFKGMLSRD
jgi:hypothetical protein